MEKEREVEELAEAVKGLFKDRYGEFRAEDFAMVAEALGFEVKTSEAAEEPEYTDHSEKHPGEGFWAMAPGAGDISEGDGLGVEETDFMSWSTDHPSTISRSYPRAIGSPKLHREPHSDILDRPGRGRLTQICDCWYYWFGTRLLPLNGPDR